MIKNRIIRNIVTMASGTVIGYVVNSLVLPIICRIYTKADIGNYDLIVSSASLFMILFMLSLSLVIMIPQEDYEANAICKIILIANIIGTMCLLLVLLLIKKHFVLFSISISYPSALLLFSLYIISSNIQAVYYSYLNRKGRFSLLFWNPIIVSIVNSGVSIFLGILRMHTVGYIIGTISGNIVSTLYMARYVHPFKYRHSLKTLLEFLVKYKRFPLIQLPANFVEYLALQLPIQFFGREYNTEMLGGYTMACKLLSMPVSLIGLPINRVYYKELVDRISKGEKNVGFVIKILKANYILIAIPIGILMIWGAQIVGFLLGEEWVDSGYYITVIGFAYIMKFCIQCIGGTFIATDNTSISIKYAIGTLMQYSLCFLLAHYLKWDYVFVMIIYTISTVINGFVCIELVNKCVGGTQFETTKVLLRYLMINVVLVYGLVLILKYT